MDRKRKRQVEDLMEELAVENYELANGGKHIKLKMAYAGRVLTYVMAATPSDGQRDWLNTRAGIRRLLRSAGGSSNRT